jgi:hypothetical protein
MTDFEQAADVLTSRDTIETEITISGDTITIRLQDITQDELDALEERAEEGPDVEAEVMKEAIEDYLIEPTVDIKEVPMNKRSQLWFGMQLAWSGAEDIQAAMDDLELPQGNR